MVQGGDGSDGLFGGEGSDTLDGGFGADALEGGLGDDLYLDVGAGDLVIEAGQGIDEVRNGLVSVDLSLLAGIENASLSGILDLDLRGSDLANGLEGNGGANVLRGLDGDDLLEGGTGEDDLFGGAGADTLFGGNGKDALNGNAGADVFAFRSSAEAGLGASRDRVVDFVAGTDRLDLGFMAGADFIGGSAFSGTGAEVRYRSTSGVLQGDVNGDGVADFELVLVTRPALTAADIEL
jgi:Ca2+-binding RTX toxin-like protein